MQIYLERASDQNEDERHGMEERGTGRFHHGEFRSDGICHPRQEKFVPQIDRPMIGCGDQGQADRQDVSSAYEGSDLPLSGLTILCSLRGRSVG